MVHINCIYLPVINYAMQHNGVSVFRLFSIENKTGHNLKNVSIHFIATPGFAQATPYAIAEIANGASLRIDGLQPLLSAHFFAQLTERMGASFRIEVFSDGERCFGQDYPIELLAFDQWGGLAVLPEMLSSFITPNHPSLVPILNRASAVMAYWTGNPSLDAYQSRNPDRLRKQMAAVYVALSEWGIVYSSAPAGFESSGQRIRLADSVLAQKMGTCLDMALLYAACLEAMGIHPVIVITRGHAFAGAWLVSETFPDSVIDDSSFLTKRTADGINEITLVETTCMNLGVKAEFDEATKAADSKLRTSEFVLAIDVKRTRFSGIRPLPQRVLQGNCWEIHADVLPTGSTGQARPSSVNPYDLSGIQPEANLSKQLFWERKLLDLSLRNNLLNLKITKNALQMISADLDIIENSLAEGGEFSILPKPTDWENPLYDFGLYPSPAATDPMTELVKSELGQKRMRSYLSEIELGKNLLHLYRASRLSMEENGANTLYMALGLLKWFETPSSERPRYAPILLLPVEIIRKSAAKGYIIRSREEEPMMNITLLEMLRQNFNVSFSGLDPLPADEHGVDVKLLYSIIRNGIKNQRKWDVEEQAVLGIFSFNKFIMWNDIHNNAPKLAQNKIVSSLIEGKIAFELSETSADAAVLDKELTPADIVLPISADAYQWEAVYEAVHDKTFVLHGPPGTGKSQTITNIIANALYRGKRVLFVAEKMAALSVVQTRLAALGLAPFCLELHSNKTKKSTVLAQLGATAELVKNSPPEDFAREAQRIHSVRTELHDYIDALHKDYPFGLSLYTAIANYLSIEAPQELSVPVSLLTHLDKERLREWEDAVEALISIGSAYGHPHQHPLTGIKISTYAATLKDDGSKCLSESLELYTRLAPSLPQLSEIWGGPTQPDAKQFEAAVALTDHLLQIPELRPALLTQAGLDELLETYRAVVQHGRERDACRKSLASDYKEGVLQLEAGALWAQWESFEYKWIGSKYFGRKKIKKLIDIYALRKKNTDYPKLLQQLAKHYENQKFVTGFGDSIPSFFGKFGKPGQEDWESISQIIERLAQINTLILQYAGDVSGVANMKAQLARQLTEGIQTFRSLHGPVLTAFKQLTDRISEADASLESLLGIARSSLYPSGQDWLQSTQNRLKTWLAHMDQLKDWYQWLLACERLSTLEAGFVAQAYKEQNIPTDMLWNAFHKGLYHACIMYIVSQSPKLELFKGKLFDDVIRRYKEMIAKFEKLTRQEIYAKLASNIPHFTKEAVHNSEVGILQRNIKNNGRGTPLRKLFDQIPILLPRMCPCMLMSPISVAQYIDPEAEKFDLVLFDEASQMPTYEAVGAIARGKNVVVVGDPKQMPPTNFFSVQSVDEEHIEIEDLESILDDCLALSMPSKYLRWHYRSKHESLIAFSNSEYYENKLLTFPSPDNIRSKVSLVRVEGCYDKGKSRQNKQEARAVVDEIVRRLSDPVLRKRSIGVVTFSVVQQNLVEDILSDVFVKRPDLESLALEVEEPLFIKNLENVQGDERDVILFSVAYGPDAEGRVSMNFGPLNRLGGERRLNVAVSRSRYEMIIYSTLKSEQIDLARTSSIGVAGLKRFLEYAERGERMAVEAQMRAAQKLSMEDVIAKALRERGHTVHTHIGSSGYKVDIGIVDPENPARYLLGILCDGETYRQTKTVGDREIVQKGVLGALGWKILRVWTLDWWEKPEEVLATIEEAIRQAGNNTEPEPPTPPTPPEKGPSVPEPEPESKVKPEPAALKTQAFVEKGIEDENRRPYIEAKLRTRRGTTDGFLETRNRVSIIQLIESIMEAEAPISRTVLVKKVIASWGIRSSSRVESYLDLLLRNMPYYRKLHGDTLFFWKNEAQMQGYAIYRPVSGRAAVDLPPEEIANAVKPILETQISLPVKDLAKILGQHFGFARGGGQVDVAMHAGIQVAAQRGYMKVEGDRAYQK